MNPIAILLHVGKIIHAIKDVEAAISDLVHKQFSKDDLKKVLGDVKDLVDSGLISIPGLTSQQLDVAIQGLIDSV